MPTVRDLAIYQLGRETTRGTPVAGTTRWVGTVEVEPQESTIIPELQVGILAEQPIDDVISTRMTTLRATQTLNYTQILHVLNASMKGVTSGTGAGSDKTWTFDPTFTGDPGLNSFTWQRRLTDGTTNYDERIAYGLCRSWTISGSVGEMARLESEWLGRPVETEQAITPAAVPSVKLVDATALRLYIDDSFGSLGTTLVSGALISVSLRYTSPVQEKFYLDGRSDRSFTTVALRRAAWELEAQVEWSSQVEAERARAQSRAIRYVRLLALGPSLGSSNYKIQFDGAFVYADAQFDASGDRDGADTATLRLRGRYDATNSLGLKAVVVNDLATLP